MRKYLAIARAEALDVLQEKGEMFVWFILELIPLFVMGSLWIANQDKIPILGVKQLVTYYFIVLIASRLTDFWFDNYMQENIRTGSFSAWLLKPLKIPFMFIPDNLGNKFVSLFLTLIPTLIALILIFGKFLILPKASIFMIFGLALINAFFIRYAFSVIAAAVAFYWDQSRAILHAKWVAEMIFGGYALPLSFYPLWLKWLPDILPFKNLFYIPASIYTGVLATEKVLESIVIGAIWSTFLLIISFWFWKKGVQKYSAVGG